MARRLKSCPTLSGIKLLILILEANINEIEERTKMLFLELKLRTASRCASKFVDFFQHILPFFLNVLFFSILFVRGSQYLRGSLFGWRETTTGSTSASTGWWRGHEIASHVGRYKLLVLIERHFWFRETIDLQISSAILMTNDKHFRDVKLPTVSSSKLGIYFSDYWVYPEKIDARYV